MSESTSPPLFADSPRFWRLFTLIAAAIAILKGLRFPVIWAASQAQADYREGFLKRGLFGELCRRLGIPIADYRVFTLLSFLILAAFLLLFLRFIRSAGVSSATDGPLLTLIAASYALSYLVSMVGYLDILLAILALLVLSLRRPPVQLAGVALLGALAVVIHEMYAIVFLPLTLLPYLLGHEPSLRAHRRPWRALLPAAVAFAVPWVLTALLTAHRALTPSQIAALKNSMLARVNFPAEPLVFDVYGLSGFANIRMMRDYLGGSWLVLETLAMLAFLPTTIYFLLLAFRALGNSSRWLRAALAVAVFAPLLMNLLAYDLFRWAALMGFNSNLASLAVLRSRLPGFQPDPEIRPLLTPAFRNAALLLIALNLATNVGMFARDAKDFPFYQYWSDYVTAKHAHSGWIHP